MPKRNIIIYSIIGIALILMGVGIANFFHKPVIVNTPVDTSKYDRISDSAKAAKKLDQLLINAQNIKIDSLTKKLNDKNQLVHETKQIKKFTPTTRNSWNDSVLRQAGIR